MYNTLKPAISATLHCLTGCAIGKILGMVSGTAFNLNNLVVMVLAFVFGYSLTMRTVMRRGVGLRFAQQQGSCRGA